MKYFYKDFATGKMKYTRAKFAGWTKRTGLLKVHYAVFCRRSEDLIIPIYLLTAETRNALPLPHEDTPMIYEPLPPFIVRGGINLYWSDRYGYVSIPGKD